jgi:hypothetical protein
MEAWISLKQGHPQNVGDVNYTRYGVTIPKRETKIDICKAFKCSPEKAKYYADKLKSDSRIKCTIHKSAGETKRKDAEKIIKKHEDMKVEAVKKEIDKEVSNEVKTKPVVKKATPKKRTVGKSPKVGK